MTQSVASALLKAQIKGCKECGLHKVGNGPIPFRGVPSEIMILGEAPGKTEDDKGRPFCGRAGVLLWSELEKVGISKHTVLTANTVCCFPDRTPTEDEVWACRPNLFSQIRYGDPDYILALGAVANQNLRGRRIPISNQHGEWYEIRTDHSIKNEKIVRVFPTYHPSAILRNAALTRSWRGDLRAFARVALGHGEG